MSTLTILRQKWKPILECKTSFSDSEIKEYNKEIEVYKNQNPNWRDLNLLHI
jgi:hypothetical protein